MDFSKLKRSEQLIVIGAVIAIISAFLPWYSWRVSVFGVSSGGGVNGLNGWWMFSFIAAVIALLIVVLPIFNVKLPKIGIEYDVLQLILGGVTAGIPVLALLSGASQGIVGGWSQSGPSIGLFGAIAGGAVILFGAFMAKKGKGEANPEA